MKKLMLLMGIVLVAGCGSDANSYFPLGMSSDWQYNVKYGLTEGLTPLKVVREMPVAGASGYELTASTGISRVAWKGKFLVATVVNNARFFPPLTLLDGSGQKATIPWTGSMYAGGKTMKGSGTLIQDTENYVTEGKTYATIKTTLNLRFPEKNIEVQTWYTKGIGMLAQTQRTSTDTDPATGRFDVRLEFVSGP